MTWFLFLRTTPSATTKTMDEGRNQPEGGPQAKMGWGIENGLEIENGTLRYIMF